MSFESQLLEWLRANLPASNRLEIGIGDDAAVFKHSDSAQTVLTTDMLTDGVDFRLDKIDPQQAGHKALGVNLSDLAAMAARPVAAFVSLVVPRQGSANLTALELSIELYRGMLPLAARWDVVIAGGDTNSWDGPLAVSITAVGETTEHGPLVRAGGQPGDKLLVTGCLGGSILGRHLAVEPRIREALLLHDQYDLHAGIDISDGLAIDVMRLAQTSGTGAVLDLKQVPIADDAHRLSRRDNKPAIDHALNDGEDFELILAVSPGVAATILRDQPLGVPIACIGELIDVSGLWKYDADGNRLPLEPGGFQHGACE